MLASLVPAVVVELYGIRHPGRGYTFSELTRATFRTNTPPGRVAFCVAAGLAAAWFVPHIIRRAAESAT